MANLNGRRLALLGLSTVLVAARCSLGNSNAPNAAINQAAAVGSSFRLDQKLARLDLDEWTRLPHPFGSARQSEVLDWLRRRLEGIGLQVIEEPFDATVPNPLALSSSAPVASTLQRRGRNLYATAPGLAQAPCAVVLATHVDTKEVVGTTYLGANDSGSSSVLLLQLLSYLQRPEVAKQRDCAVIGTFFDGEEAVLPNWTDGELIAPTKMIDHTYGSRFAAQQLTQCSGKTGMLQASMCLPKKLAGIHLRAVILLDMVGSPGLRLSHDSNSSPELVMTLGELATAMGHAEVLAVHEKAIEDDHLPFRQRGVPAIDLIDFEHLGYWHQPGDGVEHIDMNSLNFAGQLAVGLLSRF